MPDHIYEVVAQGARYWFLFWMALIAWRSWRWYRKDRRAARKRLKLLPDAGFVGEMVVVDGAEILERGTVFPVPREGTLGMLRTNDISLPADSVNRRHAWFRYDDRRGLMVEPFGKSELTVDGKTTRDRREPLYMGHGSWLNVGGITMRLRMFAGFEGAGHAVRQGGVEILQQETPGEQNAVSPEQYAQMQQAMYQQWQLQQYAQQQAYMQGYQQAMAQQSARPAEEETYSQEVYEQEIYGHEAPQQEWMYDDDPDALPYDMARIAREEGLVDNRIYMRPEGKAQAPVAQEQEAPVFYAPEMDEEPEEEDWVLQPDEDLTDAAQPPRSAYVGHDEAERAKRNVWDKYFGGGAGQ